MKKQNKRDDWWFPPVKLTEEMNNEYAWRLGVIARDAGNYAGDLTDRGLILRRLLEKSGFTLVYDGPCWDDGSPRFPNQTKLK